MPDPNRWFDPLHAERWDQMSAYRNPTRPEQIDIIAELAVGLYRPGTKLLDLGCGAGEVSEKILARHGGVEVLAVDYSPVMLARARTRLAGYQSRVGYIEADLLKMEAADFAPFGISVALSVQTLHHFPDSEKARQAEVVWQILEPGGYFLVQDKFRIETDALYPAYQILWNRQARHYDTDVSSEPRPGLRPAYTGSGEYLQSLGEFSDTLEKLGFIVECLHKHASRAVVAARKADC